MNLKTYGITTANLTVGLSATTGISGGPGVLDIVITGITGGVLWMAGASNSDTGTFIAKAANVFSGSLPLSLGGPTPAYFQATGSSVVLSILKKLSEGFSGS